MCTYIDDVSPHNLGHAERLDALDAFQTKVEALEQLRLQPSSSSSPPPARELSPSLSAPAAETNATAGQPQHVLPFSGLGRADGLLDGNTMAPPFSEESLQLRAAMVDGELATAISTVRGEHADALATVTAALKQHAADTAKDVDSISLSSAQGILHAQTQASQAVVDVQNLVPRVAALEQAAAMLTLRVRILDSKYKSIRDGFSKT